MAWRFPRHVISNNNVIEIDDINEDFRAVGEEASAELNEHNWAADSWNNRLTDLSDGVAVRVWDNGLDVAPGIYAAPAPGQPTGAEFTTGCYVVQEEQTWQAIPNLSLTINSTGGDLWVLASMATRLPWYKSLATAPGSKAISNDDWQAFGAMFGVRLNGQVLAESIVGSGDLTNDQIVTDKYRASPPGSGILGFNSPAPTGRNLGIVVEAIVPLAPGQNTIDIVVMPAGPAKPVPRPEALAWWYKIITARQVVAIEFRR